MCEHGKRCAIFRLRISIEVYDWGPEGKEEMLKKNNYVMEKEILVDVTVTLFRNKGTISTYI